MNRVNHPKHGDGAAVPAIRPFVIPVFLPHAGCTHRCVFCSQGDITGVRRPELNSESIRRRIDQFLSYRRPCRSPVQISFYGGNFLGLNETRIRSLLHAASRYVFSGVVDSIRFSTRPDTVNETHLNWLRDYPVSTVEIGVQSMNNSVLALSERGHRASDTVRAVDMLKDRGYEVGLQIMVGLPGDDDAGAMKTGRQIAALSPDFVRIYPTLVLKNSRLAKMYAEKIYDPLPLDRCVTLVKELYKLFEAHRIPVVRMGLQPSEELDAGATVVAGPYHPAFGHLVHSEIFLDSAAAKLKSSRTGASRVIFKVHPKNVSKARGDKNANVKMLKKRFHLDDIRIIPDEGLDGAADDLKLVADESGTAGNQLAGAFENTPLSGLSHMPLKM